MLDKTNKQASKGNLHGLNKLYVPKWFTSRYSKKYNAKIVVFNPFGFGNKKNIDNNSAALTV